MGTAFTDKDRTALLNALNSTGIFVTCGRQTPNIMVTHTGTLGKLWGREVFMLPIRANKYSYRIVSQTKSFALNVPAHDMRNEIALCDTISGFKCNKFETLNLHPKRARKIDAYVLDCGVQPVGDDLARRDYIAGRRVQTGQHVAHTVRRRACKLLPPALKFQPKTRRTARRVLFFGLLFVAPILYKRLRPAVVIRRR